MKITKEPFGTLKDGTAVTRYTMENEHGMKVSVLDYGATVQSILVPNEQGGFTDVALGYDDAAGYEAGSSFLGAFVGRYANRLKGAAFELNGRTYQLEKNDGNNHLHGTFCRTFFDVTELEDGLLFTHTIPDGEEGYPGTLTVKAYYRMP
ncbi:MAG: galactose-1-epimerase, partial [Lachnospiraceae bacterium]|nr:galactose-1-epimerase [Lachnospiraceae bacterium]